MADANHDQAQNEAQSSYWVAGTSILDGTRDWMAGPTTLPLYLRNIPSESFFQHPVPAPAPANPPVQVQDANPEQQPPVQTEEVPCTTNVVKTGMETSTSSMFILNVHHESLSKSSILVPYNDTSVSGTVESTETITMNHSPSSSGTVCPAPSSTIHTLRGKDGSPSRSISGSGSLDETTSTSNSLKSPESEDIDSKEISNVKSIEKKTINSLHTTDIPQTEDMVTGEKIADIDNNLMDPQLCATITSEVGGCSKDSASVVDEAVQSAAPVFLGSNEGLQRSNGSVSVSKWLEDPSHFPTLGGQGCNKDKKIVCAAKGNDAKLVGGCSKDSETIALQSAPVVVGSTPEKDEEKNKKVQEPADGENLSSQEGIRSFSCPGHGYVRGRGYARGRGNWSNASVEKTYEEYQKVIEEKRKPLQALKIEERKVSPKEFESLQQISGKKGNDDVYIKLGSKDKKKEYVGKKQKAEKITLSEFYKRDFSTFGGGSSSNHSQSRVEASPTEDPSHLPSLGGRGSGRSSSNDSQSSVAAPQAEDASPQAEDPSPSTEDPSPPTEDPSPPALGGN